MKKYLIITVLLVACQTGNSQKEALKTIQGFIAWYETNYQQANAFRLVNQGDSVFHSVNFEETEKYLAYLKSSGFVSEAYLTYFRTYFKEADEAFKKNPVNEGPPAGFDYDILLYTQEPELVFEKRNSPKMLSSEIKDNKAVLRLDIGMRLQFNLSKQGSKWMIDWISVVEE